MKCATFNQLEGYIIWITDSYASLLVIMVIFEILILGLIVWTNCCTISAKLRCTFFVVILDLEPKCFQISLSEIQEVVVHPSNQTTTTGVARALFLHAWAKLLAPANNETTSGELRSNLSLGFFFFSFHLWKKKIKPSSLSALLPACLPQCSVMDVYQGGGTVCLEQLRRCQQEAAEQRNKHQLRQEEAGAKCSTMHGKTGKIKGWLTDRQWHINQNWWWKTEQEITYAKKEHTLRRM